MSDPARDLAAAYFGKSDAELGDIEYVATVKFDDSTWQVTKDGWTLIERHAPKPQRLDWRSLL